MFKEVKTFETGWSIQVLEHGFFTLATEPIRNQRDSIFR